MYSPSLLNAMLHSVWPGGDSYPAEFGDYQSVASALAGVSQPSDGWPSLPVIGHTNDLQGISGAFSLTEGDFQEGSGGGGEFWKRLSWESLRDYFSFKDGAWKPGDVEFFDLGSKLSSDSTGASSAEVECKKILARNPIGTADVIVAIVDRGMDSSSAPNDFSGRVTHVNTSTNIDFEDHAYQVLGVLLDRLERKKILQQCDILCTLVAPPSGQIGLTCFKHANSVELLKELKELSKYLRKTSLPAIVNVSMGTHVGPHNGMSPLEACVRQFRKSNPNWFLVVAAGNDGLTGRSGSIDLERGVTDYMRICTGLAGCNELLVELWWQEPKGKLVDLELEIDITPPGGPPFGTIRIDKSHKGKTLSKRKHTVLSTTSTLARASIFRDKCYKDMSCAALALSAPNHVDLQLLDITIKLLSKEDAVVNGWIVVSDDPGTGFVAGQNLGTIRVPATVENVISVAGVDSSSQPWTYSSRGVAGNYALPRAAIVKTPLQFAPYVSHLVDSLTGADKGTSFSSPRVCADLATLIVTKTQPASNILDDWIAAILNLRTASPWKWNARNGMGGLSK